MEVIDVIGDCVRELVQKFSSFHLRKLMRFGKFVESPKQGGILLALPEENISVPYGYQKRPPDAADFGPSQLYRQFTSQTSGMRVTIP